MCVNHMSDQFCHILVDQNDVDIIALHKTLETVFYFTYWCVWNVKHVLSYEWYGLSCIAGNERLMISMMKTLRYSTAEYKNLFKLLTFVNHHEIGVSVLVDFTNTTQQETNASVLKWDLALIKRNNK